MARKTRRKHRKKRSTPRKKVSSAPVYGKKPSFEKKEEIKSWKVAVILTAVFFFALFIRTYFNVSEATDDGFKMTGGSDPYYHKRAVDWVITEHEHLTDDPMLNYPIGIPNPRPPVFDWSMALTGILISPFFKGDVETATWWAVEFMPAFWGALIVLPVYLIGKESFDKRTGLVAAFFIAIMPGHIGHTTFALADHDSFFLFFAALSIFYFQRAVNMLKDRVFVKNWLSLKDIRKGFGEMVRENTVALGYALFAGMSMSVIALSWKGFPYIMLIIIAYFVFQLFINKLRDVDSLNLSFIAMVALAVPLILSAPYYSKMGFISWFTPPLYIFIAAGVMAMFFVPTKRIPWILTFSFLLILGVTSYVLMKYVFQDFGSLVLGGAQYFVRSKLFDTIAEAQPPTFSRIVFSYGLVTFFLSFFIGIPYLGYRAFKSERKDVMFMLVWAVLGAYMASSAVRFIFNGTPVISILSAWVVVEIVDWVDFRKMVNGIKEHSARGETVADKFMGVYHGTQVRHVLGGILVVFMIIVPNFMDALDAGIPYEDKKEWDDNIYDAFDTASLGLLTPDDDTYNKSESSTWYLGSFGPSFPNSYWLSYFEWLKEQDNSTAPEERPAFISWWDYGFWSIQLGEHPTVADNFQTGYQFAGNFIAAQGEEEAVALMIQRLLDTDIRENKKDFSKKVKNILGSHLNESSEKRLLYIYKNKAKFETNNVSMENGKIRAMRDVITGNLTLEEMVDLYHELQTATGYSIRYFAIDARLFPFSATNNIFYAPITLADLTVDQYLKTLYVPGDKDGNPTGERLTAKEVEERAELDKDFRVVDTDLKYRDNFFNTMLYKAYIGWYGKDINQTSDSGIPGVRGQLQNQNPIPGWMMKHFKMVYQTYYWNPYPPEKVSDHQDAWEAVSYQEAIANGGEKGNISSGLNQGVTGLKYYDGAKVSGKIRTEKGTPVPNIRVTMYDDAMTPHDTVMTDENGEYELIAPFGRCAVIASKGGMKDAQHYLLQAGQNILNTSLFNVTDNQAMRLEDYNITQNLKIPSASLSGRVYWDEDGDGSYDKDVDKIMKDPKIVLEEIGPNQLWYNLTADGNGKYGGFDRETGIYSYSNLPPGEYQLSLVIGSHERMIKDFIDDDSLYPDSETGVLSPAEQDISIQPGSITGTLNYANGTLSQREVTLVDELDGSEKTAAANNGHFMFSYLLNGSYKIEVKGDDIFQKEADLINTLEGQVADTNITLYPAVDVSGKTYYDSELRKNITVYFNSTIEGLSTFVNSDENGEFNVKVAAAEYDVTAAENLGERYHASYYTKSFHETHSMDLNMQNTHKLSGIVYYDLNGNNSYDDSAGSSEEMPRVDLIVRNKNFILPGESLGRGQYEFNLPEGRYTIEAMDNETRRTVSREIVIQGDTELNLQMDSGFTVSGKIRHTGWFGEHGSNFITGATVDFSDGEKVYSTKTNEEGMYELYLPEGNYDAEIRSFGFKSLNKRNIQLIDNVTKDFSMDPQDINVTGRVLHNNEPIDDLQVEFDDFSTTTDAQGHYSIDLPPGEYTVTFQKYEDDFRYYASDKTTLNIGELDNRLDKDVTKQLTVSGSFLEYGEGRNGNILFESEFFTVSEDITEGMFQTYVLPGNYKITVGIEGNDYIRLMEISQPLELDMTNEDFSEVRGNVFSDLDGNNIYSGDDIGVKSKMSFSNSAGHHNETTSSAGVFDMHLYHGEYSISITADGYEDFLESHVYDDDDQHNFLMKPYPITLTGTVWFDENENNEREPIEIRSNIPVTVKVKNTDIKFTQETDINGNYSFELVPGKYTVSTYYLEEGKNFSYSDSIILDAEDEEKKGNMKLRIKYLIEGKLINFQTKERLGNVEIEFLDENGNTNTDMDTDDNGQFSVFVSEGDYTVYSHHTLLGRTLVYMERVSISAPMKLDLGMLYGVKLQGKLYTGDLDHGVDIGKVILEADSNDITLNDYTGNHGEYEFNVPAGAYHMNGESKDTDETPDVTYILDRDILVKSSHNYEDYNIRVERKELYGFDWEVDHKEKVAYIGYTANSYKGAEFVFSITNTGNSSEGVALTYKFDDKTYWTSSEFDKDTVDIPAGETKNITFTVKANDITPNGFQSVITINASVTDEEEISDSMELVLTAEGMKKGDASVESVSKKPFGTTFEGDNFTLETEITNNVEFSKGVNLTVIFEHKTSSGHWEVVGKNSTKVSYNNPVTVSQVVRERGARDHLYKVRIDPENSKDDTNLGNNEKTTTVAVNELPEEQLSGWQAKLDLGTNNSKISYAILLVIVVVIGAAIGLVASGMKGKKRSRRYRRRHSR